MKDPRDEKIERSNGSLRMIAPSEESGERRTDSMDDDPATLRALRPDASGRYDLLWDDEMGGCGTDEGY